MTATGLEATVASARYCPTCEKSYAGLAACPDDGTHLVVIATAADSLVGRELDGRFVVDAPLGRGAMGAVYRGRQRSVGRDVAIKTIHPHLLSNPDLVKRFLREAKLASRLSHPNAVAMLDFGQTPDGTFYLVMEYLPGRTLDDVLAAEGALSAPRVIAFGLQICDALGAAHAAQILHRDLKPGNLMRLDGGAGGELVKVMDFGLAKSLSAGTTSASVTGTGAILGTPAFMSPEAALGQELDARADLYSLGAVLFALATGRPPFAATSVPDMLVAQATAVPRLDASVPAALARVILRLLAKRPEDRFQSAAEVRTALEHAARHLAPARRRPVWWVGVAAGAVAVASAAMVVWLRSDPPAPPAAPSGPSPAAGLPVAVPVPDARVLDAAPPLTAETDESVAGRDARGRATARPAGTPPRDAGSKPRVDAWSKPRVDAWSNPGGAEASAAPPPRSPPDAPPPAKAPPF